MHNNKLNLASLVSGIGIGLIGRFLGRIISVLGGIIAARLLGPTTYGLYAIGLAVVRLSEVILPLGFDIGVIKYGTSLINDKRSFKGIILYSVVISLIFSSLVSIFVYLTASYTSRYIFNEPQLEEVLRFVSLIIPFLTLLVVVASGTRISHDMRYSFITQDVGQPLLALLFLGLFLWQGWKLRGVLVADLISNVLATVLALFLFSRLFPFLFDSRVSPEAPNRQYYKFSVVSSFSVIFGTLVFWIDRLMLGIYLPAANVGVYQAVAQLSLVFAVILGGMNRIITPLFASLHSNGNHEDINEVYTIGIKWALYLGVPLFVVLFLDPVNVISSIYGSQYNSGVMALSVLLIGQFVNLITGSVSPLLNVAGYQNHLMCFSGLTLVISVILNVLLIPSYGILGGAISTSLSLGVYYLVSLFFAKIKLNVWPFDRRFIKILVSALVCAGFLALFKDVFRGDSVLFLVLDVLSAYAIFFLLLFFWGLDYEDKVFISSFARFLGAK